MIYEHRFECRTRGLVFGPWIMPAERCGVYPLIFSPRKQIMVPGDFKEFVTEATSFGMYKVVIRARETKEEIWVRPFRTLREAQEVYIRLIGINPHDHPGKDFYLPPTWHEGDLEFYIAATAQYTASNSTNADWPTGNKCPSGVTATDYLVVAQGGGGGFDYRGGGGAGGMKSGTGKAVTAGTQYTITVGDSAGAGGTNVTVSGSNGSNSVFDTVTSTGGGGGGGAGGNGGSGGGGGRPAGAGGTGNGGEGNNGGAAAATNASGGGGGAGGTGAASTSGAGGAGGTGSASSISGSSVTYAGGGGGAGTTTGGTGGSSVGGDGGTSGAGTAGATNKGGGGGGGGNNTAGSAGGSGTVWLSWSTSGTVFWGNNAMMGM